MNTTPTFSRGLARRLRELNRSVSASLPWGYRVAHLLTVVGADGASALGRTSYALFIAAAVRAMPSVDGRDALDLVRDIRGPEDAVKLPVDYGRSFGRRVYSILLSRFGGEIADEAMSETLVKIARGKIHLRNGVNLSEAEALIVTVAINCGRDIARSQNRRRREISDTDDGKTIDIEDPNAFAQVERALSPSDVQRVLQDLEQVHPRARSFAEALLDGDSQNEVAEAWHVSPSYVSKWLRQHKDEIRRVLEHHLREVRARVMDDGWFAYSYDRRAWLTDIVPTASVRTNTP